WALYLQDTTRSDDSRESSQGVRPQLKRDPRRPISFLANRDFNDQPLRQVLANVYDELDYLNERLAPFLNQYRDLLRREVLTPDEVNAEDTRRVTHRVAEVTHTISHVQHLLSDLDIDPREPSRIVVRPSAPTVPGATQLSGHHTDHAVPIRAQINVNTVAFLSNGNGNLSTGETPASAGQTPTVQGSGVTVGEAAAQAAATSGQDESAAGTHQTGNQSRAQGEAQGGAPNGEPDRPSRHFNTADFLRRVSNAAFRSVSRSCPAASASSSAAGAGAGQTPSREETTASNTTTATTQTPTTAGVTMGGARSAGRSSSGAAGSGSGGTAFTMPTATASHQGLRPSTVVREIFDPFLVCDSFFNTTGRGQMGGRLRFTIPLRSSSVPAGMRNPQPREADTQPPRTPPNTAALLEAFVQSLGVFNSMPIASFINWEVGDEGSQNELISDLLATVTSTITTTDFMEVLGQHNYRSLNGLRVPLREFLNRRLLYGEPYSAELLETRLGASVDSMARDIAHETRGADVYPNVDLVATLSGFLKSRVFDVFKFIFEAEDESNFGDRLAELNIELIKDSLSLLAMCCRDGSASVERILMVRTRELERQDLEMPLLTTLMTQSGARRENVRVNEALRRYIVFRPTEEGSGHQEPTADGVGDTPSSDDRMEVDAAVQEATPAPLTNQDRVTNFGVAAEHAQAHLQSPVSHEAALTALRAAVPDTAPSAGSEWMGGVPPGWAPIIARDMGSQAAVQRPLSDAYLSGMPSKRRRLMKPTSPSQLSDIPASIQQAIQRAGVRPRTSVDALNADVQRNTVVLQDALQSSIRDALARRLTEQTADFDKDKFPNAHRIAKPK
ncbi:hypothetical protein BIW11_13207, partial [Tropilaelaps mercedesae]